MLFSATSWQCVTSSASGLGRNISCPCFGQVILLTPYRSRHLFLPIFSRAHIAPLTPSLSRIKSHRISKPSGKLRVPGYEACHGTTTNEIGYVNVPRRLMAERILVAKKWLATDRAQILRLSWSRKGDSKRDHVLAKIECLWFRIIHWIGRSYPGRLFIRRLSPSILRVTSTK